MPRRRGLSEADRAQWADFARAIRPLRGHAAPREASAPPAQVAAIPPPPAPLAGAPPSVPASAPPSPPIEIGTAPGGLDAATWERFRSGRLRPARIIDLHGLTREQAHRVLAAAVEAARAERLRCIEIITGRGSGEQGGAIRRELPLWLNRSDLRPKLLAACHPHRANPGATRLLLRRER